MSLKQQLQEDRAGLLVELVFHRFATDGDLNDHVEGFRRVLAGGNHVDVHGMLSLGRAGRVTGLRGL